LLLETYLIEKKRKKQKKKNLFPLKKEDSNVSKESLKKDKNVLPLINKKDSNYKEIKSSDNKNNSLEKSFEGKDNLREKSQSPKQKSLKKSQKPINKNKNFGVFTKYEYLSNREKSQSNKHYMSDNNNRIIKNNNIKVNKTKETLNQKREKSNKSFEKKDDSIDNLSENEEQKLLEQELACDYDTTNDYNYLNLKKLEAKLEKINKRININEKEKHKIYDKKIKEVEQELIHKQNNLKLFNQQNDLFQIEISDIERIIQLNNEEMKIKKEIKQSESKIIRDSNISQTRNEILQELNILKSDDSINKDINKDELFNNKKNNDLASLEQSKRRGRN